MSAYVETLLDIFGLLLFVTVLAWVFGRQMPDPVDWALGIGILALLRVNREKRR